MNILEKIVVTKRGEIAEAKANIPLSELEQTAGIDRPVISMKESLLKHQPAAIIAEFKRRSPSKGNIYNAAVVEEVVPEYRDAGCAGISVLTDKQYFGGSLSDLQIARKHVPDVPLLRKDFMVDVYQIAEAKIAGADLILLIAEILTVDETYSLATYAKDLGLEVLLEMHSGEQINKINDKIDIVGINNRNLKDFTVDIEASIRLLSQLEGDFLKISESGLSNPETIVRLSEAGFQGYLVGENFMKTHQPGAACGQFIKDIEIAVS